MEEELLGKLILNIYPLKLIIKSNYIIIILDISFIKENFTKGWLKISDSDSFEIIIVYQRDN